MRLIAHRRNTVEELRATPTELGVEVDVRSVGDRLIVQHDPFRPGESFDEWIAAYRHGTLILNVKEEGLEDRLIGDMQARNIQDFFFLDQSFPFLLKTAAAGERRCAVRVSEFESVDTALALRGRIDWVWIDCFTRFPLDRDTWLRLKDAGFRLCLVSPELVGRPSAAEIVAQRSTFSKWGVQPDAVCTKLPMVPTWRQPLESRSPAVEPTRRDPTS
jgi:hypothetical protein